MPGRRLLPALVAGLLLGLVAAGPVLGHAELEPSMPEDGAVLATPPTEVTLTFTEGLEAAKSSFRSSGTGRTSRPAAPGDGDSTMTATDLSWSPATT